MLLNKARCHKGVALFLVSCGFIAEACGFAGGTGEPNDPYYVGLFGKIGCGGAVCALWLQDVLVDGRDGACVRCVRSVNYQYAASSIPTGGN